MPENILIIDDDKDTLGLVGLMFQRQGYPISAAANGQQGQTKATEEHLAQAVRKQTAATLCQPDGYFTRQILRLADSMIQNKTIKP